jgi:hypothetical protein
MEAALDRAARIGPELALLFCREAVTGLYRKLGFDVVPPPVRVLQPTGTAIVPHHTMWRALRGGASWPGGTVLVRILPF